MKASVTDKLKILADAAKYDVSCASSGSKRNNKNKGLGNATGMGICHSYTEDGRCVSLLKILLTNHCIYDCAYCVSRKSNDIKRVAFTVEEVVDLTINFYRRNYIEGLFLSSGIFKNADYTNERLIRIAKKLRNEHNFNGYIHLKIIPGASPEVMREAGVYADRLSVNLEIPSERSLQKIAPEKDHKSVYTPMNWLKEQIAENREDSRKFRKTPMFAPGGQSTQMVVGATPETDHHILNLSASLYKEQLLKRVYYSGYIPISEDERLPALKQAPLIRENRLYQADWLYRFYGFEVNEIIDETQPNLDLEIDPKLGYALRHLDQFPVDVNRAPYEMILRVPGIGVKTAQLIVKSRKYGRVRYEDIKKMGAAMNRAKYFIEISGRPLPAASAVPERIRHEIIYPAKKAQLTLF
ncbi:putative DNA modification/repair radical SAM protein [Fulvivirga sp. RKSG066]|uniref:putative DNA modification/repair radical SAM protein n=1 Tax=Fulvivirga aurantia TaxID=2529383 RepID=UPI0012BB9CAA|nr:putative DNA modification/repair radical SAM protein [Fulvivirga aurantia]MTI21910.1 putative DNA modification/repair radical SAM protein [Fulvivirga aurantia]